MSVIVIVSPAVWGATCAPVFTCPARILTRCIQRRTEQNFRTDMNTSINQGRRIVRFGNPWFPIVRWLDSSASSRLSNRISTHLSSRKLLDPVKMPRAISRFITHYPWSVDHTPGSTIVSMKHVVDARAVDVSWDIADAFPANFMRVCWFVLNFQMHP